MSAAAAISGTAVSDSVTSGEKSVAAAVVRRV
jgi:hypothetical protein